MNLISSKQHIEYALKLICDGRHAVEVVEIDKSSGSSVLRTAYFAPDRLSHAAEVISAMSDSSVSTSYFVGLNPSTKPPAESFASQHRTTRFDISHREWLLIDIDPTRVARIEDEDVSNASHEEKGFALALARQVKEYLLPLFSAESLVFADSGNGFHVLLKCSAPNTPQVTSTVRRLLAHLKHRFAESRGASIDIKMFDAPRITALYGTVKRKGQATALRPWRVARIIEAPQAPTPIDWSALVALVGEDDYSESPKLRVDGADQSAKDALFEKLLPYGPTIKEQQFEGSSSYIIDLKTCPLAHEHSNPNDKSGAFVNVWPDGGVSFGCHHSHGANEDGSFKNLAGRLRDLDLPIEPTYEELLDSINLKKMTDEERRELKRKRFEESQIDPATLPEGIYRRFGDIPADKTPKAEYIVKGLFRRGELVNIVAPSKTGKTFLSLSMALAIASGKDWIGFQTNPARIAIFDNELHRGTFNDRVQTLAAAMEIDLASLADTAVVVNFRELLGSPEWSDEPIDIFRLQKLIEDRAAHGYSVILFDALYRFLPQNADEGDNAKMTHLFNVLDGYAQRYNVAIVFVHHTSKGGQGEKSVIDVGSGAGAFGRTTDCHMTMREHLDGGLHVFEARCRSSRTPEPRTLRFDYPLWIVEEEIAPVLDTTANRRQQEKQSRELDKNSEEDRAEKVILSRLAEKDGSTYTELRLPENPEENDRPLLGPKRMSQLLARLEAEGKLTRVEDGKKPRFFLVGGAP